MFSFFRRSSNKKQDSPDRSSSKRPNNATAEATMCKNEYKNNKVEVVLESDVAVVADVATPSTLSHNHIQVSEVPTADNSMGDSPFISPVAPQPRREPQRGSCVKPCGHGTTAIAPRIPPPGGRRDSPITPPPSPKIEEVKKMAKVAPLERQNSGENGGGAVTRGALLVDAIRNGSPLNGLVNASEGGEKKSLINQEAKFQSQLNDLSKQLSLRDAEASKLRFQMEELQRDVFAKSAGMDRVEAELQAGNKECEILKQRVKHLETDLAGYRDKNNQMTADLTDKSDAFTNYENETNAKIAQLQDFIQQLQTKIEDLEAQLEALRLEKIKLEENRVILLAEREEQKKKIEEILQSATAQKQEIEKKWKQDFEKLRTVNIIKEQQLLDDFEWKLREVHQSCKKRLDDKDRSIEEKLQQAYREAEHKMKEAEAMMAEVEAMKSYEIEIQQLKGLTTEQATALTEMIEQRDQMKLAEDSLKQETKRLRNLIELEKENLQHMQRKHVMAIQDKERSLKQTLNQKRTEIAMYWEERLMHECGRLKSELEQIHNEEKHYAMETVRREKDEEFEKAQATWDHKLKECLKEICNLKRSLAQKDETYRDEIIRTQTNTDRDIMELRRLMDKIDMSHHDRFEKLMIEHDEEIERANTESEEKLKEMEINYQTQIVMLRKNLESVREQMETESQQKVETLIAQHRSELDSQWVNLLNQKSEAVRLVEDEYVSKYKTLEEQFVTQQKSHEAREVELLKAIDSLKNEISSKDSALDDLQNNVDTLEGGVQVLNQEIAQQNDQLMKNQKEADLKIKGLQETIVKMEEHHEKEKETARLKLMSVQKQNQEAIDHLHRKCQCLTKLFEEVRLRYERRESRQEDLTKISDLRQVIAEQEKDLACLNEEKRYFQMRLLSLEESLNNNNNSCDEDTFEDAPTSPNAILPEPPQYPYSAPSQVAFSIPPTIEECDE